MRLYNTLRYDIRYGFISKPIKWFIILFFYAFLYLCFTFDIFHLFYYDVRGIGDINSLSLSVGDVIMFELGGKLPMLSFSRDSKILLPTSWFLAHILICYVTLHYLSEDLSHGGVQVISRVKNKSLWWFSKCLWNIITVISCYVIGYGVLYLLCLITCKNNTLALNANIFSIIFSANLANKTASNGELFLYLCALPCIVGITINLMQMTLTLYVKPIFAFIASCVYFIAGMYYANPIMISNYAMPVRGAVIGIYNFSFSSGALICLAFCIAAVYIGVYRIKKMDLVNNA